MRNRVDDVEFTRQLVDNLATVATVATVASIDRKRVFATGMSNGAIFAWRLASELSDRIAAIAPDGNGDLQSEAARTGHSLTRLGRRICPIQRRQGKGRVWHEVLFGRAFHSGVGECKRL